VGVIVGVASRAAERALLGEFDGEGGVLTFENLAPSFDDLGCFQVMLSFFPFDRGSAARETLDLR
jgi:hypothetical protein